MATLIQQAARRIGGSMLRRTHAAVTSPAVAVERRRLMPRRMYSTEKRAHTPRQEYLEKKYGHLKPHQICWEFIKFFPFGKLFGLGAMVTATVAINRASSELKEEREEAEKKREQSASTKLKRPEAEKKQEH